MTDASLLGGCDEEIPTSKVTRHFDFGQFIELFDSTEDPGHPEVPTVSRIVIQPNARLAAARNASSGGAPPAGRNRAVPPPSPLATSVVPFGDVRAMARRGERATTPTTDTAEIGLFDLVERGVGAKRSPVPVTTSVDAIRDDRISVDVDGTSHEVHLTEAEKNHLRMGAPVVAYATPSGGGAVPVELSIPPLEVVLTSAALDAVIAGHAIGGLDGRLQPVLTRGAIRVLLDGGSVVTGGMGRGGATAPLVLIPEAMEAQPLDDRFDVFDLTSFFADPWLPARDGRRIAVPLDVAMIAQLRQEGRAQLPIGSRTVELAVITDRASAEYGEFLERFGTVEPATIVAVKPPGLRWRDVPILPEKYLHGPYIVVLDDREMTLDDSVVAAAEPSAPPQPSSMTDKVQPRLPSGAGLPVAVYVPWRQTWSLQGFSRGNLLHTIALAPDEQVTMQVNSWERRSRTLDQSSETEVDQQTTVEQSARDTDDVFKEMVANRDFSWQLNGSLDASYGAGGVASISVHADGGVSDTTSIQQTARTSSQRVRESTIKASGRVQSRRVTRITQTIESGREDRVTRVIRNPNQCHTLSLDFFETLAHYNIELEFRKDHLRLVVLVPNPVRVDDFDSDVVRRNETTLRNALVEAALVDGFDACRTVAAYDEARSIIAAQKSDAAKVDEPVSQRDQPPKAAAPDPAAAQEAELLRVLTEMVRALRTIRSNAAIDSALRRIARHEPVTEPVRRAGQQWLFINFCGARFPALLAVLDELAAPSATVDTAAAQRLMAVLPPPGSPTTLANLNQMSDRDKDECTYAGKLREVGPAGLRLWMVSEWDWAWWSGRLKEEGLYTANDGGLAGHADALVRAFQAWEAKKVQGDAMKDHDVTVIEAERRQEQESTEDKLSMAFPLDELARAYERKAVLEAHLNEHKDFYNFALFQAQPPSEQALRIIEASDGQLQVGLFEPRAVGTSGSRLVIPLTPLAGSEQLREFVSSLRDDLEAVFADTLSTPDTTIVPTPGVTVSSRLGACTGCEEFVERSRQFELARMEALSRQESAEAERRSKRLAAGNLEEFHPATPALTVAVDHEPAEPS